uniref:Uncharacterized protein LOC101504168 n=1 Tax=Cicer arietinum TaxID=3827 RepID=A0A1S2Y2C4_CICAR|nr:uncharacterized protein LOC101504168 [Cicer arietinum]
MEKQVMVLPLPPPIDFNFNFNTNCSSPQHQDFEFNFNSQLQIPSLSADQLFHAGKILSLNLISPSLFSHSNSNSIIHQEDEAQQQNKLVGRERSSSFSKISMSTCDRKKYFKISESEKSETSSSASTFSTFLSSISFSKGYRKWRFKDFLLFRSASEGRAIERDILRKKYTVLSKTTPYEDVVVGNSSFRSIENSGSVSKRRGPVSAHELHYKLNRAASEELKRKTMLPYKQGLLGCLGFNHGMNYQISARFGSC